ncbi:SurA N-terminal domain-containing protein [Streptomyces pactum]|uniref:SurA N-terminal domain-containing protein n=1 Tax=Streptomyces pactum TaxID=68249 RepID=A0ABS0NN56_9ACTN|nr:SurA N-terminal domain-containing protein [Streptomyces pactum]MBH5336601.1 SurA N-terminal domain-containing protein [Streptomyces pactum]
MIRRRTALSVSAASAVLLAAPLLTACGNDARPGAAAVIDGERITVAQLQANVRVVRDAQRESPQARQLVAGSGRLNQDVLARLIKYEVIERAARQSGVTVTRREVQQARKQVESRQGGADTLRALYLQQGVAPRQIDQEVRVGVTRVKLDRALGPQGASELLVRTSKALDIEVNPRYGTWDDMRGLALAQDPWLRPAEAGRQQQQPA